MTFIQENNIEINIGLSKQYNLIHISDVHAVTYEDSDSKEDIEEAIKAEELWYRQRTWFADKAGEKYDDCHMIPSSSVLDKLIEYINNKKPDLAILSGDIIDYYSKSNYELLINNIKKINVPYLSCSGNHDAPAERYSQITNSSHGFMCESFDEFKVISLDNSSKAISNITLNRLKEEVKDEKPIIVVMHIPLLTSFNKELMSKFEPYFLLNEEDSLDSNTKEFIEILKTSNNIKAVLCGHLHAKSETEIAPGKKQYCASSGLIGFVNNIIIK